MSEEYEIGSGIVDRVESGTGVVELLNPETTITLPIQLLPDGVQEGMGIVLKIEEKSEVASKLSQEIKDLEEELVEKPDDSKE